MNESRTNAVKRSIICKNFEFCDFFVEILAKENKKYLFSIEISRPLSFLSAFEIANTRNCEENWHEMMKESAKKNE